MVRTSERASAPVTASAVVTMMTANVLQNIRPVHVSGWIKRCSQEAERKLCVLSAFDRAQGRAQPMRGCGGGGSAGSEEKGGLLFGVTGTG
jgi:hypothetical protein